ncbi:MAG: baseplate J/gp47 family protein [Clostridia bacterium]|nr:baseplate J/gp47 family protein [Clostridia bacterium]
MSERYTSYDQIMYAIMNRLPDDIDKREGSVVYIMLSALAEQLAMFGEETELLYDAAFADTAEGEDLDRVVKIFGLERKGATCGVVRIESDSELFVGDVFTADGYDYEITSCEDGYYLACCTTAGSDAMGYIGEILPKETASTQIGSVEITAIVSMGSDGESDEELRARYFDRARYPVCAGNLSYYRDVLSNMQGVGGAKIVPVANGAGTVKVIIMSEDMGVPSDEALAFVKEELDPAEYSGEGRGLAPIGHVVSVEGVESVDIEISVRLTMRDGTETWAIRQVLRDIGDKFAAVNATWGESEAIVLRDSFFEECFLSYDAVKDVEILSINGEENRLILEENQILGSLSIENAGG